MVLSGLLQRTALENAGYQGQGRNSASNCGRHHGELRRLRAGPPFILNYLSLTKRTCGAWGRKPASSGLQTNRARRSSAILFAGVKSEHRPAAVGAVGKVGIPPLSRDFQTQWKSPLGNFSTKRLF